MKRQVSVGLAVVLLAAVVVIIISSGDDDAQPGQSLTTVRGVGGSEKAAFFADPRVVDVFARHGLRVAYDAAGSRQIATTVDLTPYDFAFPSSSPAAERIKADRKVGQVYTPFSSPMAVATFAPIADLLAAQGVVKPGPEGRQVFDIAAYLDLAAKGTRWDQLPGNTAYPARKNILVTTTDPRDSNSAAMYLALVSYVANGNSPVASPEAEARVLPAVSKLFLDQGYTQSSSEGPFEDYLATGMGKTPLVMIYESQYLDRQARADGSITPQMRLIYPAPTVYSTHTLVPLKGEGDRVGKLLGDDPDLVRLAAEFGFRPYQHPQVFQQVATARKLTVPADVGEAVNPPSYETLERLLEAVGKQYR
ncbi:hypothetical protein V5P93_000490 [Actinokineospora auranticolor]|uniref:Extracellular solute-binding protein n=1 Tax=Actinokineospora auranticolor TaxID=155976 RepID=A0A2S6GZG3_9PSEU|nr:hypothetical protein [Actinokineospora auranticolor]PPK70629.1 hypothetical protein CLV40_102547 [Actinokineospora auranticolor]